MHETNKKPMKGWIKLLVTFLGGALIATLVILTTSGVFFTGALIKGGGYMDPGTLAICDSTCTLTTKVKDLTTKVNNFIATYNSADYAGKINNLTANLDNFKSEVRSANFSGQLNNLTVLLNNFMNEVRSANYSGQINNLTANLENFKLEVRSANYSGQINGLLQMYDTLAGQFRAHTGAHNAGNYPPIWPY
jgi:hypothetical protein